MRQIVFMVGALCLAGTAVAVVLANGSGDAPHDADRVRVLLDDGRARLAVEAARSALDSVRARHGDESLDYARAIDPLVEALTAAGRGADGETLALAERAAEIKRRELQTGDPDLAKSLLALATVLAGSVDERERALALLDEAERTQAGALGDDDPALAETLAQRGYLLLLMGRAGDARPVLERSLAIREGAFGREHRATAQSLHLLSYAHQLSRNLERAQALAEDALAIRERLLRPGHPDVAASLASLAAFRMMRGERAGLLPLLERAYEIREEAFGPEHPATLDVLWNLALQLNVEGQLERSESRHLELVSIYEKQGGPYNPKLQGVLRNLGGLYNATNRLEDARDAFRRALEIGEANDAAGGGLGRELHNLALVLKPLGQLDDARGMFERSLSLLEESDGPESRAVALVLHSFGNLKLDLGEYTDARRMFERSLAIRETLLGGDHALVAHSLVGVAESLWELGDRGAARPRLERALEIYEGLDPPAPGDQAYVLIQLGRMLGELGDFSGAERLLDRAIELGKRGGLALDTFGELRLRQGRYEEAIERFARSLETRERKGEHGHPDTATTLVHLADALDHAGRREEARSHLARALEIRRASFGPAHPETSRAQVRLARVDRALGRDDEAFDEAITGHLGSLEHVSLTIRALSERRALAFAAAAPNGLDVALSIVVGQPRAARTERVWDAVARTRALVLDEMAERVRTDVGPGDRETNELRRELGRARARLANLLVVGPTDGPPERYVRTLHRARRESEEAERALAERSAGFAERTRRDELGWRTVAAGLPERSAVVSYVRFERLDRVGERTPSAEARHRLRTTPWYGALVLLSGGGSPALVDLGAALEIERLVRDWRGAVATEPPKVRQAARGVELAYRAAALNLRKAVWDPVARQLGGSRQVFVVPDGDLHFVSFATLPAEKGRYLVESGPILHLLSSERDLLGLPDPARASLDLLAVGAPDFDADPAAIDLDAAAGLRPVATRSDEPSPYRGEPASCASFRQRRFTPLPAAAREVSEIARMWRGSNPGPSRIAPQAMALTGARATEGLLKRLAPGHGVLHFATHGFFLGDDCSSPAPYPEATRRGRPRSFWPTTENPLHLSGLALAGGNRRSETGGRGDDGVLTAEEIASLDLRDVGWVVLSACDTGLGAIRPREGVLGLRRAFRVSGARSLIMSLWAVEDDAAREWMETLYRGRASGLTTAGAVRRASVEVLGARRASGRSTHPFYWGAFVASGDWR